MNRDHLKATARDLAGKLQERFGRITGNKDQQMKGIAKQVAGKLQKRGPSLQETLDKLNKKHRCRPFAYRPKTTLR